MTVHNHGTEDGPGLSCRETRDADGRLRGDCLEPTATHVWVNYKIPGTTKTQTVAFTDVPLAILNEAIAHIKQAKETA